MIYRKTVFNVEAKGRKSAERRLQIDILALRESYDLGELYRIAWIPGTENPADSLIKPVLTHISPLFKIMRTNLFTLNPEGWAISHETK